MNINNDIKRMKQLIREKIWKDLEENKVSLFPRPIKGRIPNFVGAEEAAELLSKTKVFKNAELVKISPDSPQRPVREIALREGKKVLVPTPRLRGEFYLLDPDKISDYRRASTIAGLRSYGLKINLSRISKIDLIVIGSVAVTLNGDRVGKGEGYSELEYAILRELNKVDENTPIVTTVHELQIVDFIPNEPFDVPVDAIVTPNKVYYITKRRLKPAGLYLEYLDRKKIEETPFLKEYLLKYKNIKLDFI
jgi:5-formyltetrahydrofolate cyclo-ligase